MSLFAGAGAAHAADVKQPAKPPSSGPGAIAPDAAAARASRLATANHALGSYYDAARNEQVVVASAGSKLTEASVDRAVGADARLVRRNITSATVDTIQERVSKRAWSPQARNYNYASWLDLKTGRIVLKTNAPASVTAPLTKDYPSLIDQQADTIRDSFSRQADVPSFWGGSSIKSGGAVCSSGFVVQKPTGQRFLTTAGHCFAVGANVLTTGGNLSLGSVTQRGPFLPWPLQSFDMELIGGGSYGSSIFVGGTNSSTGKHVNGAGDPVVGFTQYCRSGQTSGEQCGQTVQSVNAQVCTQTGCKSPVISYTGPVSQPGDSGAPFYVYSADSAHVFIRGLNVASGGSTSFAEKWSRISSNLGVSIVT
ncbi:MAG: hypothetical protein QOJ43_2370 [Gaiellaceae bacterium]|nr:hypothetical protein [Gaiellaceae bacterium]